MEPDPAEIEAIEDGEVVNPHGMDPQTVLRFVKTVGGWPGKVVVVACEPDEVEEMGLELSPEVAAAVERAVDARPRDGRGAALRRRLRGVTMHELSISSAIVDTAVRHADGRRVTQVDVRVGALRQVVPDSLEFYFGIVSRDTAARTRALELELVGAWLRCEVCGHEWDPAPEPLERYAGLGCHSSGARRARAREPRWSAATSSRSSRSRSKPSRRSNAPHQGEGRRGRAGRQRDDRPREPRRLRPRARRGGQPHERSGRGQDLAAGAALPGLDGVRVGRARGRRAGQHGRRPDRGPARAGHRSSTPSPASAASATWTRTWSARRSPTCRSTSSTCW